MDKKILEQLEELKKIVAYLATNMVTKDDAKNFITKDDAKNFATKDDLNIMEKRLSKEIRDVETSITLSADKHKAEKKIVDDLEKRVSRIEHKFTV